MASLVLERTRDLLSNNCFHQIFPVKWFFTGCCEEISSSQLIRSSGEFGLFSTYRIIMTWEKIKEKLRSEVEDSVFCLWIEPLECTRIENENIFLGCPDRYFSAYVTHNYLGLIQEKTREAIGQSFQVQLECEGEQTCISQPQRQKSQLRLPHIPVGGSKVRNLHPRYTFAEFMVGESNILAQSACKAVSNRDDSIGPCLFITSKTGLGKSHLTHAVAHQILAEAPMTRLQYLTAKQFSSEMVKGITTNQMDVFKRKYHEDCDILLIEDVHTLAGKKKTQEELNELLDIMIKTGKRVVFTANNAPRELEGIDGEFCSRMTSGLVTTIKAPDIATRMRIVARKAVQQNLDLEEEFVEYLAQHIKGDVRKIESAMVALKARSNLTGGAVEKALVQEIVAAVAGATRVLTPAVISEFVGGQFKVSVKEMQSRSRKRKLTFPRQVAMYLSRKHTNESLADIGKIFNRDHSTVLHSIKAVSEKARRDNSVEAQVALLSDKINQL